MTTVDRIEWSDVDGEYAGSSELLAFLQDHGPVLHGYEYAGAMTMHEKENVIDALESGEWMRVFDPVDTEEVR